MSGEQCLQDVLDADITDVIVKSWEDERLRHTIKGILNEIMEESRPSGPELREHPRDPRERDDNCHHNRERRHDDSHQAWILGKGKVKGKGKGRDGLIHWYVVLRRTAMQRSTTLIRQAFLRLIRLGISMNSAAPPPPQGLRGQLDEKEVQ